MLQEGVPPCPRLILGLSAPTTAAATWLGLILGFLALACSLPGTEYVIQNGRAWHLLLCSLKQVSYFNLSSNVVLSSVSRGGNEIRTKPSH